VPVLAGFCIAMMMLTLLVVRGGDCWARVRVHAHDHPHYYYPNPWSEPSGILIGRDIIEDMTSKTQNPYKA